MKYFLLCLSLVSISAQAAYFSPRKGEFQNLSKFPTSQIKLSYEGSTTYYDPISQRWTGNASVSKEVKWIDQTKFKLDGFSVASGPIYLKGSSSLSVYVTLPGQTSPYNSNIFAHDPLAKTNAIDKLTLVQLDTAKLRLVSAAGRSIQDHLKNYEYGMLLHVKVEDLATGASILDQSERTDQLGNAELLQYRDNQFLLFNNSYKPGRVVKVTFDAVEQNGGEDKDRVLVQKVYTTQLGFDTLKPLAGDIKTILP